MKKYFPIVLIVIGAYFAWDHLGLDGKIFEAGARGDQVLADAFRNRTSGLQVEGSGEVIRVLRDDNDGSRHQRFIVELGSGHTLLVAHNIDLAARIPSLQEGDDVAFHGEYEWDAKGGVIHWTHHDPKGRHVSGWLRHNGRTYK